jgi:hypothetical protein
MSKNNNDIKRLNYFNGQLLDDNDFRDEQTYHIDMRRRLNQLLYNPGVVKGLVVTKNSDKTIIVSSGFAIDVYGCEVITLADSPPLDVNGANTSIYVTISYSQPLLDEDKRSKDNIPGVIRFTERPIIKASSDKVPVGASAGQDIILAKIKLDANGVITDPIDTSERQLANLRICNGKLGIGTSTPGAKLQIEGANVKTDPLAAESQWLRMRNTTINIKEAKWGIAWDAADSTTPQAYIMANADYTKNYDTSLVFGTRNADAKDAKAEERMRITASGKVGIGTTQPSGKLTVSGSSDDSRSVTIDKREIKFRGDGVTHISIFGPDTDKSYLNFANTNSNFMPGISGTSLMVITDSGNVGIGTQSPGEKLEIKSGKLQLDGNQQIKFTDTDITNNLKLQLYTGYGLGINASTLFYAANGKHSWRDNTGTNERMLLTTGTDGGLTVKGTGNSSFAGKLGIGTTDPGVFQMNVAGTTRLGGVKDYGSETLLSIAPGTVQFDAVNVSGGRLTIKGDTGNVGIGTNDPKSVLSVAGGLAVGSTYAKTNAAPANGLLVEGNVGIGTASPGARLEVAGTLTATLNDETLIGLKLAPTFQDGGKTAIKRCTLDVAGAGNTVNQISLQVKSGNNANKYDSTQITFGYNNTAQYRHAIKTRHHGGQQSGNAIDFYLWKYSTETGAADKIGSLHTLTLDGGNVGIGTTSPASKLTVSVPVQSAESNLTESVANNGITIESTYEVDKYLPGLIWKTTNDNDTKPKAGIWLSENDNGTKLYLGTSNDYAKGITNKALTINPMGNVGIGTTDPINNLAYGPKSIEWKGLHVFSDKNGLGIIEGGALSRLHLRATDSPTGARNFGIQLDKNGFGLGWMSDNLGPGTTALTINGKGNVGIGTDKQADVKLRVEGDAYVIGSLWANKLLFHWSDRGWCSLVSGSGDERVSLQQRNPAPSDRRFKTDVRPIRSALDKVLKLHGQYYRWGEEGLKYFTRHISKSLVAGPNATEEENQKLWEAERQKAYKELSGNQMGLIAQNLEAVVPELVTEDKEGYKYVDYQHLIALLVEAIKEQNEQITALAAKMAS